MSNTITSRIAALLKRPGATKAFLADAAGIHRNILDRYDTPDWNPTKRTLDKIAAALDSLERLGK